MDGTEVALAAIALAATSLGAVIWALKYFAETLSKDLQAHTKAAEAQTMASNQQAAASKRQEAASNEVLQFMRNLNGKLTKATIDTAAKSESNR